MANRSPRKSNRNTNTSNPRMPGTDHLETPELMAKRLTDASHMLDTIESSLRTSDQRRVERVRQIAADFKTKFRPDLRSALSAIHDKPIDSASYVAPGASVLEKSGASIERGIQQIFGSSDIDGRRPAKSIVALTEEQKKRIQAMLHGGKGTINAAAWDQVLGRDKDDWHPPSFLTWEDPSTQFCRDRSWNEIDCTTYLDMRSPEIQPEPPGPETTDREGGDSDIPGRGLEAMPEQGINRYVAQLLDTMTSPEEQVVYGLQPLATRPAVENDLEQLSFAPSPADTAAYHDFHSLEIAFEPVWQELIDEGILDLAEAAYHDIVELGGRPNHGGTTSNPGVFHALIEEARRVLTATYADHDSGGQVVVRDHRGKTVVRDHRQGYAQGKPRTPEGPNNNVQHPADRLPQILAELEQRLKEQYAFTIYAANRKERSINFGILITYRQEWKPLAYQAGRLAKTVTLAPKETQKYSKKTIIRRKRAEREVENHLSSRREEASQTSRAEQEIIRKATTRTNFSLTAKDSLSVPLGEGATIGGERTATFEREASKASDDVKKSFHEAVFKSAQEYKDEHNIEVNAEESAEVELVESGEITNPNDEIAVTFLFYELQRRYKVTEHIYRIQPVLFVAQEMPRPDEIDEDWLLSYDWMLRRVLLDDSFAPALNYLSQNVVGEQVSLNEMRENINQQRRVVEELRRELGVARGRLQTYQTALDRALMPNAAARQSGGGGGIFSGIPVVGDIAEAVEDVASSVAGGIANLAEEVGGALFGSGATPGPSRQDVLKEAMQRAADGERDLLFRMEREVTSLNALTEAYTKALADYLNHKTQVARLRVHVKQNILYYMQAIWSHEPRDQRYFRLHNVAVPILRASDVTYSFPDLSPLESELSCVPHWRLPISGRTPVDIYRCEIKPKVDSKLEFTKLSQLADLDDLLGYKGNYMIFPLKESNALTEYMMSPYIIAGLDRLVDPDDLGNWTLETFSRYLCCLQEELSDEEFQKIKPQLRKQYERLLTQPRRNGDTIVVPTNSLFIEALPARHSLIEEFKARHRAIDVKKVQAEARKAELENVRAAARILGNLLDDPDIESVKQVYVDRAFGPPDVRIDEP